MVAAAKDPASAEAKLPAFVASFQHLKKSMATMIALIEGVTSTSVASMGHVAKEVATSLESAHKTQETLEQLVHATGKVTKQSLDIATATQEQSSAVQSAARNMEEIAANMEQNMHTFKSVDNTADAIKKKRPDTIPVDRAVQGKGRFTTYINHAREERWISTALNPCD